MQRTDVFVSFEAIRIDYLVENRFPICPFITVRNSSGGKVFHKRVTRILSTGGTLHPPRPPQVGRPPPLFRQETLIPTPNPHVDTHPLGRTPPPHHHHHPHTHSHTYTPAATGCGRYASYWNVFLFTRSSAWNSRPWCQVWKCPIFRGQSLVSVRCLIRLLAENCSL